MTGKEREEKKEMRRRIILIVCHNHPSVRPGGAETYALELHRALRKSEEFRPILLVRGGPPLAKTRPHEGTLIAPVNESDDEYFFYAPRQGYDEFYGTFPDKEQCGRHFREFLKIIKPDIVHFQHTLLLGYDLIQEVHNTLPHAPIIYTLHEFLPICYRQGQMLRTDNVTRCLEASPRKCHECFPNIPSEAHFLRKLYIQNHFSMVDIFIAPSHFLLERYVDWGVPRHKIIYEEYGRSESKEACQKIEASPRNRLGYFGQITPYKGVEVLLEAMKVLETKRRKNSKRDSINNQIDCSVNSKKMSKQAHLWIHGANLELQPEEFKEKIQNLLSETQQNVTMVGIYAHSEISRLMSEIDWVVVPSIWWENSPLVIQEAFQHKRPVICSDIGGMAEKVKNNVNGLHFRVGDRHHLAEVLQKAIATEGLWQKLSEGIQPAYLMKDHLIVLKDIYNMLQNRFTKGR